MGFIVGVDNRVHFRHYRKSKRHSLAIERVLCKIAKSEMRACVQFSTALIKTRAPLGTRLFFLLVTRHTMKSAASQRRKTSRSIYKFFTKLNGLHLQSDAASFLEKHFEDQPDIDEALSQLAKAYKKQFTGTFWSIE